MEERHERKCSELLKKNKNYILASTVCSPDKNYIKVQSSSSFFWKLQYKLRNKKLTISKVLVTTALNIYMENKVLKSGLSKFWGR